VQDALRVLRSPDAKDGEIASAVDMITHVTDEQPELPAELIRIWAEASGATAGGRAESLRMACLRVDERSAGAIVSHARRLLRSASAADRDAGTCIYGVSGKLLAERMRDPEALLRLFAERGCLDAIRQLAVKPEVRDRYLIESLLVENSECGSSESLFCDLSPAGLASLPPVLQRLASGSIQSRAFNVVLRTLVDAADPGVESFLRDIQDDPRLTSVQRSRLRVYLVKLRSQHSTADLLRVLRTETERDVLSWAAWRLLWLKVPLPEVLAALVENRPSAGQRSAAPDVATFFSSKPDPEQPTFPTRQMSLLALDADELRRVCPRPNDPLRTLELFQQLSLQAILKRAAGEGSTTTRAATEPHDRTP
jgi:hypothetical protein